MTPDTVRYACAEVQTEGCAILTGTVDPDGGTEPRTGLHDTPLPAAVLPATTIAFTSGKASLCHVEVVAALLRSAPAARLDDGTRAGPEQVLAERAVLSTPAELRPTSTTSATIPSAPRKPWPSPAASPSPMPPTGYRSKPGGRRPSSTSPSGSTNVNTAPPPPPSNTAGSSTPQHQGCSPARPPCCPSCSARPDNHSTSNAPRPDSQLRAVTARDRGCAHPGCDRPPSWCEAHHVLPWEHGGPPTSSISSLLCRIHRRLVHRSRWEIRVTGGRPEFVPPGWIDHNAARAAHPTPTWPSATPHTRRRPTTARQPRRDRGTTGPGGHLRRGDRRHHPTMRRHRPRRKASPAVGHGATTNRSTTVERSTSSPVGAR